MKKTIVLLTIIIASLMLSAEQKAASTSTSTSRLPKDFVGTIWTYENGYSAERRTIEFINAYKVRYTIEDINIWTAQDPPIIKIYDCYFNPKSSTITIKRKSDMTIEFHWMHLRLGKRKLIECTNPNVEVEYERVK